MKNKIRVVVFIAPLIWMTGCVSKVASGPTSGSSKNACTDCGCSEQKVTESIPISKPERYIAWLEGEYQTNYEPNRTLAEKKLERWEGKVPEDSDVEGTLEYLSVLDASGKPAEVEKRIKKFIGAHSGEKRGVFLLAVHYLRRQKYDLARYLLNQLEKEKTFTARSLLYNNLGMLALKDGNRGAAIEDFEKASKESPPTAAPLVNLGAFYLQSRSYADAEKLFRRAVDIDAAFEDAALGLGVALEGQGKNQEAYEVYAAYTTQNPDALSVLFNNAVLLGNRLQKREEAAQLMLRYIQRGGRETAKAHEIIQSWR